jgi:DNA-binding MarR family transcriptional regulator
MSDVLARLMRWMETSDIDDADVVLRDAITEIAGLRARLHERRRMLTLTDEERQAIMAVTRNYQRLCDEYGPNDDDDSILATIKRLLERLN